MLASSLGSIMKMCTGTLLDRGNVLRFLFKLMFASACGVTSLAITATPSISPFILRCLDKQKCNAIFQFSIMN
jgi:hypothetical protein